MTFSEHMQDRMAAYFAARKVGYRSAHKTDLGFGDNTVYVATQPKGGKDKDADPIFILVKDGAARFPSKDEYRMIHRRAE